MSSRTPEECIKLAGDTSADQEEREDAIHELKMANECDELADLVRNSDLENQFQEQALRALATSQCDSMLQRLVEDGSLNQSLQQDAENLLSERGNS